MSFIPFAFILLAAWAVLTLLANERRRLIDVPAEPAAAAPAAAPAPAAPQAIRH